MEKRETNVYPLYNALIFPLLPENQATGAYFR
jgi:hypothetical protein